MKHLTVFFSFILAATVLVCPSCEPEVIIKEKEIHFDEFAEQLETDFGPGCVGFQYVISQNGQLVAENAIGNAILEIDGQQTAYTTTHRKSVHSMSKTITAAGMMSALDSKGLSIDDFIYPYLPEQWNLVTDAYTITFRQILSHKSGLRGTHDTYDAMRDYFENGEFAEKDVPTNIGYANVNFSVMRLLIPMVINKDILNGVLATQGPNIYNTMTAEAYLTYIRDYVLGPAGVSKDAGPYIWDGPVETATRNYNFSDQTINGTTHPDGTLIVGAGSWYLNANDYSAFLAYLLHGQLSGIDHNQMISGNLGMFKGKYGSLETIDHNGSFTDAAGCGGRAQWIHIPTSDVTVVVQINSANNSFSTGQMKTMILDAYLDAYY